MGAAQLRRLHPLAVRSARLQSKGLELAHQIIDRQLLARRRHAPALELIRGQHPDMLVETGGVGLLRQSPTRGQGERGDGNEKGQAGGAHGQAPDPGREGAT